MRDLFTGCKSLVYINLISFIEKEHIILTTIFSDENINLIYCIDENKSPTIINSIKSISTNNNCNNTCFTKSRKIIIEKKKCIDECINDDTFIYESNGICYNSEQEKSDTFSDDINDYSDNIIETEKNDNSQNIQNNENPQITENIPSTENMEKPLNTEISEKIIQTESVNTKISEEVFQTDSGNNNKEKEENTDKNNYENNVQTEILENNEKTEILQKPESSENLEFTERPENNENNKNIEKNIYTENNKKNNFSENIHNFSSEYFFNQTQEKINENRLKKDEIIKNIKEDLIKGKLDFLLQNVINGTKQDLIAIDNDIIYQITTSENQNNNNYSNISTINLGECENKLKEVYHIDNNLSLIILKIDYFMEQIFIPVIGYEVYHPIDKFQLDLSHCKDIMIKLNIPVSINEDNIFKHDPNSEYYNDECNRYTTDNGTDILLNDRQNEYIENNLSLCENNCTFKGYNKDSKKALCECETKPKIGLISEIIQDKNILSNNFNNTNNSTSNIVTMKCIDTLFSKEGLLTNIGNYLLLFTFGFFTLSIILFYRCGYHMIEKDIDDIIKNKKNDTNLNNNKINIYERKRKYKSSSKSVNKHNRIGNKKKKSSIISNPLRKNIKKSKTCFKNYKKDRESSRHMSSSKLQVKSINIMLNLEKKKNKLLNSNEFKFNKNQKKITTINYLDCELNSFDYQTSLKYDKRTFCQYYFSLLLSKHIILFSFYLVNDYNIKIIKITLFLLSFDIYFVVNTLFFNNSEIHQIYSDGGAYNISFFMSKIIYSFIISYIIINFIRYFSLSERYLIELKNENNKNIINDKGYRAKRCLIIKYISFYVLCFIFLTIFWFYLSSFCAVYQNSQIYVFKNAFISFGIFIIYPIIFNLLPTIFRFIALKDKNQKNECIFKLSKILQLI